MFQYHVPTKLYIGRGVLSYLPEWMKDLGKRVFFVSQTQLEERSGLFDRVESLLSREGFQVLPFARVDPYSKKISSLDFLEEAVSEIKNSRTSIILTMGDSATLQLGKTLAFLASNSSPLEEFARGRSFEPKTVAYVQIPTEPGLIPGLTPYIWILDRSEPYFLDVPGYHADSVVLDYDLMTPSSKNYLIGESLAFSIESILSRFWDPFSSAYAHQAIDLIQKDFDKFLQDLPPSNDWDWMSSGALASLSLNSKGLGMSFALGFVLASQYSVPKSMMMCILFPRVLEFLIQKSPQSFRSIASSIGLDSLAVPDRDLAYQVLEKVKSLFQKANIPANLNEVLEFDRDVLLHLSSAAQNLPFMRDLPHSPSREELIQILESVI